jgi:hypothetical protein
MLSPRWQFVFRDDECRTTISLEITQMDAIDLDAALTIAAEYGTVESAFAHDGIRYVMVHQASEETEEPLTTAIPPVRHHAPNGKKCTCGCHLIVPGSTGTLVMDASPLLDDPMLCAEFPSIAGGTVVVCYLAREVGQWWFEHHPAADIMADAETVFGSASRFSQDPEHVAISRLRAYFKRGFRIARTRQES